MQRLSSSPIARRVSRASIALVGLAVALALIVPSAASAAAFTAKVHFPNHNPIAGKNWVITAVVVRLPAISRPVAIPVLAKLVIKDTCSASRLWLARRMVQMLAEALPGRAIHVVAGSA